MESVSLPEFKGFDWDEGNADKNWESPKVSPREAEQVFFNRPLIVADDVKHSGTERRYFVLGQTDHKRTLFVAFTLRGDLIRVISACDHEQAREKGVSGMKDIPQFKSEDEERQFWAEHDSTEYVDWSKAKRGVFPNLKPSVKTISLTAARNNRSSRS